MRVAQAVEGDLTEPPHRGASIPLLRVKQRHVLAVALALYAAIFFVTYENVFDRDTYIDIVSTITTYDFSKFLLTFNGVEFGSMGVFYLLGVSGLPAMTGLACLVFVYTYLAFSRVRKHDQIFALALMALAFYGTDYWTNQLRSAIALALALFFILKKPNARRAPLSLVLKVAATTLFHIQNVFLALALLITTRMRAIVALLIAIALRLLSIGTFLNLLGAGLAIGEKADAYAQMDAAAGSIFMKVRILAFAALALHQILFSRQKNLFAPLVYANGLVAIIFWDAASIFGRLSSTLLFFEPFFVMTTFKKVRIAYIAFLIMTTATKILGH